MGCKKYGYQVDGRRINKKMNKVLMAPTYNRPIYYFLVVPEVFVKKPTV
jgi:hypothetical protein